MFNKNYLSGNEIANYVRSVSVQENEWLIRLREETAAHPEAIMQISPEQGALFQLLIQLTGARRTLEIGVFTGYSSLAVALALPADGAITACDVSEEFTSIARRYWESAGVADKIDLRLGPALQTLETLLHEGRRHYYDFVFIDADKPAYDRYYELCLELVRPGGLIALDNMLYHGQVPDLTCNDENPAALRALNSKLANDSRVTVSLLPIADGIMLALKR
jgi:predicted O-methyltransferase YrrM